MKKLIAITALVSSVVVSLVADNKMEMQNMGGNNKLDMVNQMSSDMQLKLKFDYVVNFPILMRAAIKNSDNKELNLSKEQLMAIKKHKIEVMDTIDPIMEEAHKLSINLKHGMLNGTMKEEEAHELAKKITQLKEQVLHMKITCSAFMNKILSKEQMEILIKIDKKMPYLNSPYNY